MGQGGDGRIDEINLLGKLAAQGGGAAEDEEAVEDFGCAMPAAVAGALAAVIAGDDDEPIFPCIALPRFYGGDNADDELVGSLDRFDILRDVRMKAVGVAGNINLPNVEKQRVGIAFSELLDRFVRGG